MKKNSGQNLLNSGRNSFYFGQNLRQACERVIEKLSALPSCMLYLPDKTEASEAVEWFFASYEKMLRNGYFLE